MSGIDDDVFDRALDESDEDPFEAQYNIDANEGLLPQIATAQKPVSPQPPQQTHKSSSHQLDVDTSISSCDPPLGGHVSPNNGRTNHNSLGSHASPSTSAFTPVLAYTQGLEDCSAPGSSAFERRRQQNLAMNNQILKGISRGVPPSLNPGTRPPHTFREKTPPSHHASLVDRPADPFFTRGSGAPDHAHQVAHLGDPDRAGTPRGSINAYKAMSYTKTTPDVLPSIDDEHIFQRTYQEHADNMVAAPVQNTPPETPPPPTPVVSDVSSSAPSQGPPYGYTTCKFVLAPGEVANTPREPNGVESSSPIKRRGPGRPRKIIRSSPAKKRGPGRPRKNTTAVQEPQRGSIRLLRRRSRWG